MMKKILLAVVGVAAVGTIGGNMVVKAQEPADLKNYYPKTGIVTALSAQDDLVVVRDACGQLWCFSGMEDWEVGDVASMIMDDMGTETIYDDQVLKARYAGYFDLEILDSVIDWSATDTGLQLYFADGTGYYIEK